MGMPPERDASRKPLAFRSFCELSALAARPSAYKNPNRDHAPEPFSGLNLAVQARWSEVQSNEGASLAPSLKLLCDASLFQT